MPPEINEHDNGEFTVSTALNSNASHYSTLTGLPVIPEYDNLMKEASATLFPSQSSQQESQKRKSRRQYDRDLTWLCMLHKLVIYKFEHNGDTSVPHYYTCDQAFGNWCAKQRLLIRDARNGRSTQASLDHNQMRWLMSLDFHVGGDSSLKKSSKSCNSLGDCLSRLPDCDSPGNNNDGVVRYKEPQEEMYGTHFLTKTVSNDVHSKLVENSNRDVSFIYSRRREDMDNVGSPSILNKSSQAQKKEISTVSDTEGEQSSVDDVIGHVLVGKTMNSSKIDQVIRLSKLKSSHSLNVSDESIDGALKKNKKKKSNSFPHSSQYDYGLSRACSVKKRISNMVDDDGKDKKSKNIRPKFLQSNKRIHSSRHIDLVSLLKCAKSEKLVNSDMLSTQHIDRSGSNRKSYHSDRNVSRNYFEDHKIQPSYTSRSRGGKYKHISLKQQSFTGKGPIDLITQVKQLHKPYESESRSSVESGILNYVNEKAFQSGQDFIAKNECSDCNSISLSSLGSDSEQSRIAVGSKRKNKETIDLISQVKCTRISRQASVVNHMDECGILNTPGKPKDNSSSYQMLNNVDLSSASYNESQGCYTMDLINRLQCQNREEKGASNVNKFNSANDRVRKKDTECLQSVDKDKRKNRFVARKDDITDRPIHLVRRLDGKEKVVDGFLNQASLAFDKNHHINLKEKSKVDSRDNTFEGESQHDSVMIDFVSSVLNSSNVSSGYNYTTKSSEILSQTFQKLVSLKDNQSSYMDKSSAIKLLEEWSTLHHKDLSFNRQYNSVSRERRLIDWLLFSVEFWNSFHCDASQGEILEEQSPCTSDLMPKIGDKPTSSNNTPNNVVVGDNRKAKSIRKMEAISIISNGRNKKSNRQRNSGKQWVDLFLELETFKGETGHCMVPRHYAPNQTLASFVAKQRSNYQRIKEGFSNDLTKEKIMLLNELGFVWDSSETDVSSAPLNFSNQIHRKGDIIPKWQDVIDSNDTEMNQIHTMTKVDNELLSGYYSALNSSKKKPLNISEMKHALFSLNIA